MFELDEVHPKEQVPVAGGYLRELALESFRLWFASDKSMSWKTLKDKLLTRFRPYYFQIVLRSQLENCKQDGSFSLVFK